MDPEMTEGTRRRVAVACQGGGSHTAFTAGVLDRLLAESEPAYEIVALTGTSGGGICAFLAWYGLVSERDEEAGRERARALLAQVWDDIAATDPVVAATNRLGVWWADARDSGVALPAASPYASGVSAWTTRYLRRALERAVPPDELAHAVATLPETAPTLHLGAVDVERGTFRTFTERDVTIDAVLASAAVPTVFRAVTVDDDGRERRYWDGLFSQNPPVHDLLAGVDVDRKPEEIWLVRINPQRRESVPTDLGAIADRRNELSGNLSVNQELAFIRRVNEWVAAGTLSGPYRQVAVRTVGLDEDRLTTPLTPASKLDCRPAFVAELRAEGRRAATDFLDAERNRRLVRGVVDATWNTDNPAPSAYLTDDFELHAVGAEKRTGPAAYGTYAERVRGAFEGFELRVETSVAERDRVALTWTARGRHVGRCFGVAPSDEVVTFRGVEVARVVETDGGAAVAETWLSLDDVGLTAATRTAGDPPVLQTVVTPVVADVGGAAEARRLAVAHAERLWGHEHDRPAAVARLLVDRSHVFHGTVDDVEGRDAYVAVIQSYREAFPDLRVSVRDVVAEGNRVIVRAAMTGTHRRPFAGVEPSGRRVEAHWAFVHEVSEGRITATGMLDSQRWLRDQLSARPLPARRRDGRAVDEEPGDRRRNP
jgi:NTE family protein